MWCTRLIKNQLTQSNHCGYKRSAYRGARRSLWNLIIFAEAKSNRYSICTGRLLFCFTDIFAKHISCSTANCDKSNQGFITQSYHMLKPPFWNNGTIHHLYRLGLYSQIGEQPSYRFLVSTHVLIIYPLTYNVKLCRTIFVKFCNF